MKLYWLSTFLNNLSSLIASRSTLLLLFVCLTFLFNHFTFLYVGTKEQCLGQVSLFLVTFVGNPASLVFSHDKQIHPENLFGGKIFLFYLFICISNQPIDSLVN